MKMKIDVVLKQFKLEFWFLLYYSVCMRSCTTNHFNCISVYTSSKQFHGILVYSPVTFLFGFYLLPVLGACLLLK